MNKIVLTAGVLLTGIALYLPLSARLFENGLCRRYPHLTRNEVREAFAQYLTNAEHGQYGTYREAGTLKTAYVALDEIVQKRFASS